MIQEVPSMPATISCFLSVSGSVCHALGLLCPCSSCCHTSFWTSFTSHLQPSISLPPRPPPGHMSPLLPQFLELSPHPFEILSCVSWNFPPAPRWSQVNHFRQAKLTVWGSKFDGSMQREHTSQSEKEGGVKNARWRCGHVEAKRALKCRSFSTSIASTGPFAAVVKTNQGYVNQLVKKQPRLSRVWH